MPGATGIFTTAEGGTEGGGDQDTLVLVSTSPAPSMAAAAGAGSATAGYTRVLAFEEDSRVVELAGDGDGNPFVCDAATVDLCAMAGGTVVQAHAQVMKPASGFREEM